MDEDKPKLSPLQENENRFKEEAKIAAAKQIAQAFGSSSQAVQIAGTQKNIFNVLRDESEFPIPSLSPPFALLERANIRGRDALVADLLSRLTPEAQGKDRVIVLHGLGGNGKTSVALMLAREAQQRDIDVWWVWAADAHVMASGMRAVAFAAGASPQAFELANAADVMWWMLRKRDKPWLLVVDNVDDPRELLGLDENRGNGRGWLRPPDPNGLVVVTTRDGDNGMWGGMAQRIPVPALDQQNGAEVLLDLAPQAGTREEAVKLAARLGGLPLALHLSGAALQDAWSMPASWASAEGVSRSFEDYRQALDKDFERVFALAPSYGKIDAEMARGLVGQTWELSLTQLKVHGYPDATPLLRLLACLGDSPVPFELLLNIEILAAIPTLEGLTLGRLWAILGKLSSFGLINLTEHEVPPGRTYRQLILHALVRDANRVHADVRENIDLYCSTMSKLLIHASAGLDPHSIETWKEWNSLAPHCVSILDIREKTGTQSSTTLDDVAPAIQAASYWLEIGLPDQAKRALTSALDVQRSILGEHSLDAFRTRGLLAAALREQGLLREAAAEYRSLLDVETAHLGPEHPQSLATRNVLARVLRELGNLDQAEAEMRAALAGRMSILGPNHPDTLNSRRGLALLFENRGDFSASQAEYRSVIHAQEKILGPNHVDVLGTKLNHARVLQKGGQLELAEAELRSVLRTRLEIFGESNRHTIQARYTLAFVRQELGHLSEAETEYRLVLDYQIHAFGIDHPSTLATRSNLARVLQERGQLADAETEYRSVLRAQEETLGPDNPETLSTRHGLAFVRLSRGHYEEAEAELCLIIEKQTRILRHDHPDTLASRSNLARALQHQGRLNECAEEFMFVLAAQARILGENCPETLATRHGLAFVLQALGKHGSAAAEYQAVITLQEQTLGPDHPDTLGTRHNFARLHQEQDALAEAELQFRAVLVGRTGLLGDAHPDTLGTRHALAYLLELRGDLSEARAEYQAVIALQEQTLGPDHPDTLGTRDNLTRLLHEDRPVTESQSWGAPSAEDGKQSNA
jgi:tetratricopeptide (TPR) repeat protein